MKMSLQILLSRKKSLAELLRQATVFCREAWCIEDPEGRLIFGEPIPGAASTYPIKYGGETLGHLKSQKADTFFVATLIENWIRQEAEKRQLATEALHLYRQINLVFSFSEKLADTVSAEAIAQLTLREAGQIIRFEEGGIFIRNDKTTQTVLLAQTEGFSPGRIPPVLLQQITQQGKSEIVAYPGEATQMILFAALNIGLRSLGAIVLIADNFIAADLKLLSTLAVQSATALENAAQHALATAKALEEQHEKRTMELALKNPFFKKVMTVVERRYADPEFSVAALSGALHLSISQLQRKIAAITDLTPVQIIRNLRLACAKTLLETTDCTVSEVAFQAGFNDPSYFTRLFVKTLHCTPTEWKEARIKGGE